MCHIIVPLIAILSSLWVICFQVTLGAASNKWKRAYLSQKLSNKANFDTFEEAFCVNGVVGKHCATCHVGLVIIILDPCDTCIFMYFKCVTSTL